jgi:hypothetical protein
MPAQPSQHSALTWRKSKESTSDGQCVEIACAGESVMLRDSRDPSGPILAFSSARWSAFLRCIRNEESPS